MGKLSQIELNMLKAIADLHKIPEGAYNIRADGQSAGRNSTEHIEIVSKTDKQGIDIIVKPGTKNVGSVMGSMRAPLGMSKCAWATWAQKASKSLSLSASISGMSSSA